MSTGHLSLAILIALVGGTLLWWRARVEREMALMVATKTSSVREVAAKPPGSVVVLQGKLATDAPLKGQFSGRDCVYYRALVEREVRYDNVDTDGAPGADRSFETVSSTEEYTACRLEDASGSVPLDWTAAKVEALQSHQHYVAGKASGETGSAPKVRGTILGHRYTEWIIPPGVPVYVLAAVAIAGVVGASPRRDYPFVVSCKSEKERMWSLAASRLWLAIGATACFLVAAGLAIWSIAG
jgi:hypothetical protein